MSIARTNGLEAALDGKAASSALAGKQDSIGDGDLSIARTSGLQAALDSKATSSALAGKQKQDSIGDGDRGFDHCSDERLASGT